MRRHRATIRVRTRGFTLVEMLIAILIIAILMGLLLVGFSHAIRLARRTAGTQDIAALDMAVQQFRSDFDFLPPLIKDGFAGTPDTSGPLKRVAQRTVPNVYSFTDPTERSFLQDEPYGAGNPDYRFSVYSLSYYIMGALGEDPDDADKKIDGVVGPGAKEPNRDGSFNLLTNTIYEPLFEPRSGSLETVNAAEGRIELRDASGVAYRYYRWAPVGPSDSGYSSADQLANLRLPKILGDPAADEDPAASPADANTAWRDAEYAIVAAGPDGLFGDLGVSSFPGGPAETAAMIEGEYGKNFTDDAEAEAAARGDNIVRAGR